MSKQAVLTDKAPKPLPGIYSQAIIANGFVYCSGAVPMDPATGKLVDGDIQAHTVSYTVVEKESIIDSCSQHQCIKNLGEILSAAESGLDKVVEVNVFLASMDDFAKMNEIYCQYWGEIKPARTFV